MNEGAGSVQSMLGTLYHLELLKSSHDSQPVSQNQFHSTMYCHTPPHKTMDLKLGTWKDSTMGLAWEMWLGCELESSIQF